MKVNLSWTHKDGLLITTLEDLNYEGVTITVGYTSDGGTMAKIFWCVLSPFEDYAQSCILHDYLCDITHMQSNSVVYKYRKMADEEFNKDMKLRKIKTSTRLALYFGVTFFRWIRYNPVSIKLFGNGKVESYNLKYFKNIGLYNG